MKFLNDTEKILLGTFIFIFFFWIGSLIPINTIIFDIFIIIGCVIIGIFLSDVKFFKK